MTGKRFMFFENFMETANKLPDDLRLKYYDAIMDYVFNGKEPDDPVMAALINSIKPSLDKEETRGGNHNPTGKNQHGEVKVGQNEVKVGQNEPKLGQSGQSFLEAETETEEETETKKEPKERNQEILDLVNYLKTNLMDRLHRDKLNTTGWYEHIGKMVELDGIKPKEIKLALGWYFKHYGETYIPVIQSAKSLREKFLKLLDAVNRSGETLDEEPKKDKVLLYVDHDPAGDYLVATSNGQVLYKDQKDV